MKADAASGKQHPMELKKALARRIVQDFHGEQAAKAADEGWAKQFQKDEVPEDVEYTEVTGKNVVASPQDIYSEIMSLSDDEARRHHELMNANTSDQQPPAKLKLALARRIAQIYYSAGEVNEAYEDWRRRFQGDEIPDDMEMQTMKIVDIKAGEDIQGFGLPYVIRMDKLIVQAGLAASATEAQRKRKEKAVKINDKVFEDRVIVLDSKEFALRVGKRIKRIKFV
jgi:tyrosyl-tRNA synthetase